MVSAGVVTKDDSTKLRKAIVKEGNARRELLKTASALTEDRKRRDSIGERLPFSAEKIISLPLHGLYSREHYATQSNQSSQCFVSLTQLN